jgi:hypothetical protein
VSCGLPRGRSEHQPDHSNEQLFDHEAGAPSGQNMPQAARPEMASLANLIRCSLNAGFAKESAKAGSS